MNNLPLVRLLIAAFLVSDSVLAQDHWETAIFADDNWNYIIPSQEPSSEWNTVTFDDSDWLVGSGGFGYGDNDDGTTVDNGTISVFMRRSFTITELTKLNKAILHADYDDGFVAYLNGVEVFRSFNLSDEDDTVPYDATTNIDHEAQLYTGLVPEAYVLDSIDIAELLSIGNNMEFLFQSAAKDLYASISSKVVPVNSDARLRAAVPAPLNTVYAPIILL